MTLNFTYFQTKNSFAKNIHARITFKRRVIAVTQKHDIQGFTMTKALGAWQGKTEPSFQMAVIGISGHKASALARALRDEFDQDSVMVQRNNGKVDFI